jgi:hypothetical protein
MVDGFHLHMWTRTMKPHAIALSGAGRGSQGRWWGQANQCTMQAYSELSQWIFLVQWIYPNKNEKKKRKCYLRYHRSYTCIIHFTSLFISFEYFGWSFILMSTLDIIILQNLDWRSLPSSLFFLYNYYTIINLIISSIHLLIYSTNMFWMLCVCMSVCM